MQLRVATYNIHKGVMGLRKRSRIHDLRVALNSIDADIVFLQEVQERNERMAHRPGHHNGTQLDVLCTGGYLHRAYGMNAVYPHGHHGNAIVSRHTIGQHLNHDISDHALEKRGLLHAISHIDTPRGEFDIHLINTHFGLIKRSRVRQAEFLIDFVRSEVPEDAPLIIAGDFNDWRRKADRTLVDQLGVVDVFRAVTGRAARTYPSVLPVFHLDRIYARGLNVTDARVHLAFPGARISDHAALAATFEAAPPRR